MLVSRLLQTVRDRRDVFNDVIRKVSDEDEKSRPSGHIRKSTLRALVIGALNPTYSRSRPKLNYIIILKVVTSDKGCTAATA